MQVKDVMTRNVIAISPEDHVNKALSIMKKNRINQLPVTSKDSLYGMLELKKIVSRDIDIKTTKAASIATSVPHIDANASIESAVELLLGSGLRALPVTEVGKIVGIISETDLMKVAKQYVKGLNQMAKDITTPADCLAKSSNYGQLKKLVFEKNISRMPVLENNMIVGIVSTLDMIRVLESRDQMSGRGGLLQEGGAKEKVRLVETEVGALMRPATVVKGETMIGDVIEMLKDNEEVVVQTEDSVGIITPRDVIELFAAVPKKQLYVQITGMHDESIEFRVKMDQALNEFVQKISRMVPCLARYPRACLRNL